MCSGRGYKVGETMFVSKGDDWGKLLSHNISTNDSPMGATIKHLPSDLIYQINTIYFVRL